MKSNYKKIYIILFSLYLIIQLAGPAIIHANKNDKASVNEIEKRMNKKISVDFRGIDLIEIFKFITIKSGLNIAVDNDVTGKISLFLKNITIKQLINVIIKRARLAISIEDGIINIMKDTTYETIYGKGYEDLRITRTFYLKYAKPENIFTILNNIKSKSGNILIEQSTKTLIIKESPGKLKIMEDILKKLDKPTVTITFALKYSDIETIKTAITPHLTPDFGTIETDKRTRTIIVTDFKEKIKEIKHIVSTFDKKFRQVLIEAKIVKVELNDEFQMGIDWEYLMPSSRNLNIKSAFSTGLTSPLQTLAVGKLPNDDLTAALNFIKSNGNTEILSNPHIMVMDGERATIHVGESVPIVNPTITTSQGIQTESLSLSEYKDIGISLDVLPTITADNFISMVIKPEVSQILEFIGDRYPRTETSKADTTVTVKDGVTIIIGGLIKTDKKTVVNKVPLLGDLPLLGMLFRNTSEKEIKSELVIFVTPKIVTGEEDVLAKKEVKDSHRKPLIESTIYKRKGLIPF